MYPLKWVNTIGTNKENIEFPHRENFHMDGN